MAQEADIFARYLVGKPASKQVTKLYEQTASKVSPDKDEQRLITFACNHPHLIGALDGGLALLSPNSELRRRIYIMFALLEATPEQSDQFLPQKRQLTYLLVIGLTGIRAIFRAIFGIIVIKAAGLHV